MCQIICSSCHVLCKHLILNFKLLQVLTNVALIVVMVLFSIDYNIYRLWYLGLLAIVCTIQVHEDYLQITNKCFANVESPTRMWICEIFMCTKYTKSHTSTRKIVFSFHITLSKVFNTQPIFYKDPCQSTYDTRRILVFQPSFCRNILTSSYARKTSILIPFWNYLEFLLCLMALRQMIQKGLKIDLFYMHINLMVSSLTHQKPLGRTCKSTYEQLKTSWYSSLKNKYTNHNWYDTNPFL